MHFSFIKTFNFNNFTQKIPSNLFVSVLPGAIQISGGKGAQGIHTLTMTNSTAGGAIVQYAQGQEFFVPGELSVTLS